MAATMTVQTTMTRSVIMGDSSFIRQGACRCFDGGPWTRHLPRAAGNILPKIGGSVLRYARSRAARYNSRFPSTAAVRPPARKTARRAARAWNANSGAPMSHNLFNSLQEFKYAGKTGKLYSLPALEKAGLGKVSRLPISLRIVLETALRNYDGKKITEDHLRTLAGWKPKAQRVEEVPFVVARVLLQDMTGVPLVVDFAAMREAAKNLGKDPDIIEPIVPGHL